MGVHLKCLFSLSIFNQTSISILHFIKKISSLLKKFPVWNLSKFFHTDRRDIVWYTVCVLHDTEHKWWLQFQTSYSGDAVHTTNNGDSLLFLWSRNWSLGGTRWCSWLRHCATSRKVAGSIADGVIRIFHGHYPSGRTMALGLTQPLTEMSTRNISWGIKAAGA
jgi:hypothetical protein